MAQLHRCPRYVLSRLKVLVLVEQDGSKEAFQICTQDGLSHVVGMLHSVKCMYVKYMNVLGKTYEVMYDATGLPEAERQ